MVWAPMCQGPLQVMEVLWFDKVGCGLLQCADDNQGEGEQCGSNEERGATSGAPLAACQGSVVTGAHAPGRHDPAQERHAGQKLTWLRAETVSGSFIALPFLKGC